MSVTERCTALLVTAIIFGVIFMATVEGQGVCGSNNLFARDVGQYITSPGYPDLYSNNMHCEKSITANSSSAGILLTVWDFNLEGNPPSCPYDYVDVYNGSSTSSPRTQRWCGSVQQGTQISTGPYITLVFHSDNSNTGRGFKIGYISRHNSGSSSVCSYTDLLAEDSEQFLFSPGYPSPYPSNLYCQRTITSNSSSSVVVLNVLDFYLEGIAPSCTNDYLIIYDGPNIYDPIIQVLCGTVGPAQFTSTGSEMTVRFVTNSYNQNRGFKLGYSILDESDLCGDTTLVAGEIGQYLTSPGYSNNDDTNSISSTNSTSSTNNTNSISSAVCRWTIEADLSSRKIMLSVVDLALRYSPYCNTDFVAIYDGNSTSSPRIKKLCGQSIERDIISTGPFMTVVFIGSASDFGNHFKLEYTSVGVSSVCSHTDLLADESEQLLVSPGYPFSYSSNLYCQRTITSNSSSSVVVLNMLDFSLDGYPPACTNDYLIIYDGPNTYDPIIQRLCGTVGPTQFTSIGSDMTVRFVTDSYNTTNRGFKLGYSIVDESDLCGDATLVAGEVGQYLTSPGYSNDDTNKISNTSSISTSNSSSTSSTSSPITTVCRWTIEADSSSRVVMLSVVDMALQYSPYCNTEFVAIYNGNSTSSPSIQRLCGQGIERDIISSGPFMTVVFIGSSSDFGNRFKLEYTSLGVSSVCSHTDLLAEESEQFLISPGYPLPYSNNLYCQRTITSNSSSVVVLNVQDFYLGATASSCTNDYVIINDGPNTYDPIIQRLCGTVEPTQFTSTGSDMTVMFVTDSYNTLNRGFKLGYFTLDESDLCGDITLVAGEIGQYLTSPGYHNNDTNNISTPNSIISTNNTSTSNSSSTITTVCRWSIEAANSSSRKIVLSVVDLALRYSPYCNTDFVAIYDGNSTSSPRLQKLCGQGIVRDITSTGPFMTVVFIGSSSDFGNRFKLEYTSLESCTNITLGANNNVNYIKTPGYPNNYVRGLACQWSISADSSSDVVVLKLLDMDLAGPQCYYDYVVVYDGPFTQKWCGQANGTQFTSSGPSLSLGFFSWPNRPNNGYNTFRGVKLEYISQKKSAVCSNVPLLATKNVNELTSPNYPDSYPSNISCQWTISADSSASVVLKILDFSLQGNTASCSGDYVTIYDGYSTSSPIIQQVCGQLLNRQFTSTGPFMTVAFQSDETGSSRGFKLQYNSQEKSDLCQNVALNATENVNYIASPDYPNNYPSNLDCQWTVSANSNTSSSVIVLDVIDLYLEESPGNCNYDYVTIYQGSGSNIQTIQKLCGQVSHAQFKSTGPSMTVVFRSDGATNFKGFKIGYSSQQNDLCANPYLTATGTGQYTVSPGYPNSYPSYITCQWTISADTTSRVVVLKVLDFFVEGTSPSCSNDYLAIYDGANQTSPAQHLLCGQVSTTQFTSSGPIMTIVFYSDGNNTFRGFKLEYTSKESGLCTNATLVATDIAGYITSPAYPNYYPSAMSCQWSISADISRPVIVLKVLDFQLEGLIPDCTFDYVAVYDGNSTNSPLAQRLCGQVSSQQVISTGPFLTVVFHSDGNSNFRGFKLEYSSQGSALCADLNLLAKKTGQVITSPGYPNNYPSNMGCQWTISADSPYSVVVLNVEDFELEGPSPACTFDNVAIYDGPSASSPRIQLLCGHQESVTQFTSTGPRLTVVFRSDGAINFKGFRLGYTSQ
jgi:cubilin